MSPITSFLTGPIVSAFILHGEKVAIYAALIAAIVAYFYYKPSKIFKKRIVQLLLIALGVRAGIALLSTLFQYFIWKNNELTVRFLPPYESWSYFINYVSTRFWMALFLALVITAVWYGFLWLLGKGTSRFFDTGEKALGALTLFLTGCPLALVFSPLLFVSVIAVSLFRMVVWKQQYTTMGLPMLFAAVITLLLGSGIQKLFGF